MKNIEQFTPELKYRLLGVAVALTTTGSSTDAGTLGVNLTIQSVFAIVTGAVCWFSRFALVAMVVAVIVYGIQFMMSQGDPTKYSNARTSLTWGIIGIAVILGTYTIIATVANAVGANYTLIIPLNCSAY